MKLPKTKRERKGLPKVEEYWINIPVREDLVMRVMEEYGPDHATWSSAGNAIMSDALAYRSYQKKQASRLKKRPEASE